MHKNYQVGDIVTVNDPSDAFASWNTEFRGTVQNIRGSGGSALITVESPNGQHIEVTHYDISNR